MAASANLARLHGERIGHLSRYDSTDLLREELAAVAGLLQAAPVKFAFRKAFFGAGGKHEHWDRFASPLLEANASVTAPSPIPQLLQDAVAMVSEPLESEPVVGMPDAVALAVEELVTDTDTQETKFSDEEEVPEEALPWDELTAELAEAEKRGETAIAEVADERQEAMATLSEESSLDISPIAERGIAVKAEGAFGAGEYGGSRFLDEVNTAVQAGAAGVLLDLSGLEALRPDCSAPILACAIKLQTVGGRFAIVQPPAKALAILDATGIVERVDCFEDESDAMEFVLPACENAPVS